MAIRRNTKPRAAFSFGVTVPIERKDHEKSFASIRAEASFEDFLRKGDGGSILALRRRVRDIVLKDLDEAIRKQFAKYNLDKTGRMNGSTTTWA